ncbi:MAG: TerB family tellurite resistance protein [Phycisphaerales bacterium]|nr:TerB family tellurite resistance protein [Phycisphaerales bacterium]
MNTLHSFDAFELRGRSFEERYFHAKDAELVDKLRAVFQRTLDRDELKRITGLHDEALIERLLDLSVRGEMLTAFKLLPLVEIAWADGSLDHTEAAAVEHAATRFGVTPGPAMDRLREWLKHGPTPELRALWQRYATDLRDSLSRKQLDEFREDLLATARGIADRSGGVLNVFFNTSSAEKRILESVRTALSHAPPPAAENPSSDPQVQGMGWTML